MNIIDFDRSYKHREYSQFYIVVIGTNWSIKWKIVVSWHLAFSENELLLRIARRLFVGCMDIAKN